MASRLPHHLPTLFLLLSLLALLGCAADDWYYGDPSYFAPAPSPVAGDGEVDHAPVASVPLASPPCHAITPVAHGPAAAVGAPDAYAPAPAAAVGAPDAYAPAPAPAPADYAPAPAPTSPKTPIFMEYIGASGNPMKFNVPINEGVDFRYILGFAVDASPNGTYNNGNFVELWDSNLTPHAVSQVKAKYPNVKVMMSLCGWSIYNDSMMDQPLFWYEPKNRQQWLDNAFNSISNLVDKYHLDGLDIDYENFNYPNNFSSIMGELIQRLKKEEVVSMVSIAPFNWMVEPYIDLYKAFNESIDYVNYQFYADALPNPHEFLARYNKVAKTFGYEKLFPSYEINGRGVQGQAWWDSLTLIHKQNPIPGLMIWSADDSEPMHYYYETQSQALLANGTLS